MNGHSAYPDTSNGVYEQKMQMWGDQSYGSESITLTHKTNNAHPSAMSGVHSLHSELIDSFNVSGMRSLQDHMHDLNYRYEDSRAQRIRAAMFPETFAESEQNYFASHPDYGQSSNVQRLAAPSQMLKMAIMALCNYQEDAQLADRAIPELIKLLNDENKVIVGQAAMMLHELSKREAARHALVRQPQLIQALLQLVDRTDDPNTAKNATGSLFHLSQNPHGLLAIFRSGGIPALVKMLYSPHDEVLFYAITTLHNLLMHQDGAKQEIRQCGGVPAMCQTQLINRPHEKFLAILFDCIHYLCVQHEPTKLECLQKGVTGRVVQVLQTSNYEKLLYTASRLLKVLSVCAQNKATIVQQGGMQAAQRNMHGGSARLVRNCLLSVRNMSDAATKEENIEDMLRLLVKLLQSSDTDIVCCCCGILSNLTCNNQRNKALNAVRTSNGFGIVAQLLATMRPPVVKAALGLVRNLATLPANLQPLREQRDPTEGKNMVQLSAQILDHAFATIHDAQKQGSGAMPIVEGISMLELVECSVAALHQFAKDTACRAHVRALTFRGRTLVAIFVHLLSYEHESIQREATGVLHELCQEPEGARMIEHEGATAVLTELLHSRNEAIATYAGAVLYKLSRDKPSEIRQQLGMEMASALYRDDSNTAWANEGLNDMQAMPSEDMFHDVAYGQYGNRAYEPSIDGAGYHPGTWTSNGPPQPNQAVNNGHNMSHMSAHSNAPPGGWYDTDL